MLICNRSAARRIKIKKAEHFFHWDKCITVFLIFWLGISLIVRHVEEPKNRFQQRFNCCRYWLMRVIKSYVGGSITYLSTTGKNLVWNCMAMSNRRNLLITLIHCFLLSSNTVHCKSVVVKYSWLDIDLKALDAIVISSYIVPLALILATSGNAEIWADESH